LLGALHGLEPGHSKTMMAAFIVAIRGTIAQAVLLGLSAAISHSFLVWLIAAAGMYYGNQISREDRALLSTGFRNHYCRYGHLDVLAHPP
jgi:nickel/cobalt exporter